MKESEGSRYLSSLCFLLPSSSSSSSSSDPYSLFEEGEGWSALVKRKEEGEEIFCSVTASRGSFFFLLILSPFSYLVFF